MSMMGHGAQRHSIRASRALPIPKSKSSKFVESCFFFSAQSPYKLLVRFISKAFAVSRNAPYHWEEKLAKECTANEIYHLLVQEKFNHYVYNGTGSGWPSDLDDPFSEAS